METEKKSRVALAAGLLIAAAALAFQCWALFDNARGMCDDALISARYARNWASGAGLTYTAGRQPVEGYSNFLWVEVLAAGFRLGVHPRITTAYAGGACAILAALVTGLWTWRLSRRRDAALAAGVALALSLSFNVWAVQGLETPLFALLLVATAAAVDDQQPTPWPWLFALFAALCRPDGLLAAVALAAVELRRPRPQWKAAALSAVVFALPFLAYTGWRIHHFGPLLPNTFSAKTGLGLAGLQAGFRYVIAFITRQGVFGALLVFSGFHRWDRPQIQFGGYMVAAYAAFVAAVGGDFMPDFRFMMHLAPLIAGLGVTGVLALRPGAEHRLAREWPRLALVFIALGTFLAVRQYYREPAPFNRQWHRDQQHWYGRPSSWLLLHSRRDQVIAAGDIGYLGYVTDNPILDFNGLVDPHLASLPGAAAFSTDPGYVFGQKPAFLVLMVHRFTGGAILGHTAFDRAALSDPRLAAEYEPAAELPGWSEPVPVSGKLQDSDITFRILRRKD